jgi:hypothetical protein
MNWGVKKNLFVNNTGSAKWKAQEEICDINAPYFD